MEGAGSGGDREWEERQNSIQRLECVQKPETVEHNTGRWMVVMTGVNITGVNGKS